MAFAFGSVVLYAARVKFSAESKAPGPRPEHHGDVARASSCPVGRASAAAAAATSRRKTVNMAIATEVGHLWRWVVKRVDEVFVSTG